MAKEQCGKHEEMVIALTKLESEVKTMREQHVVIGKCLETMTEKLITIEKNVIWWAGAIGALSFSGTVVFAILTNADKLKALFG